MALQLKLYQSRSIETLRQFLDEAQVAGPKDAFAATVDKGLDHVYKPMPGLPDVPYACLRIPTGGGKTIMGADIINAARGFLDKTHPLVLWLVPTKQIKTQTLEAFQNPAHPYRKQLDEAFKGQVAVFDIADFTQIRPADLGTKVCLVLSTIAALRVEDTEGRKVYEDHEDLDDHFGGGLDKLPYLERDEGGRALHSFANLCHLHRPLVITDEAHNANTPLSYTVYERLRPQAVVELTATPKAASSNVLVSVSAFELKNADMIKFPVVLKEHIDNWRAAVSSAVARRKSLAQDALKEPEYIRPIVLIQAENKKGDATVEEVKKHLMEVDGVNEKAIAVATGDQRELDGIDLFDKDCPIEFVITKQALKEGWDCSFAYVFCSVAQVKSDKDIQQLLGRVLRMPYATKRVQESMSKAYAHVVSDDFGRAAGELTQSLVDIGFNPLEAAAAIEEEKEKPQPLPLPEGGMNEPTLPTTTFEVDEEPDLTNAPEGDAERVKFTPNPEGKGGVVEIRDDLDKATEEALEKVATDKEEAKRRLTRHQHITAAAKAPSQRGAVFQVPRLYIQEQGELELLEAKAVAADFAWDLLAHPADLSGFRFDEQSKTYEVFLDGREVKYKITKDDVATYLPGFAQDRTADDLVGWLDQNIRDPSVKQPVTREWVRRAVKGLMEERRFSLAQLLKGQFILRRKLREELDAAKVAAYKQGFQQLLFESDQVASAPEGSQYDFTYPADMTKYPAHHYYEGAYAFSKHFYPRVGDLTWKTGKGKVAQEFECARVIDELEEVEFWVRNLVHKDQFWMPTSRMRTYPDFVAKLKDGRLLVVEFKGSDRFTNDESEEKRNVGALWQKHSNGRGIYVMTQMPDGRTSSLRDEILAAIKAA